MTPPDPDPPAARDESLPWHSRSGTAGSPGEEGWRFSIDRGGTFTDCIARDPRGRIHVAKLLSSDDAPVEAIRRILEGQGAIERDAALPPCSVRLGSTVATNALLERRGCPTALVTNRGLADVFQIGTQERPDLFALDIAKPRPLHATAVEVSGRVDARGLELEAFDIEQARAALAATRAAGAESVALVLMHSYLVPGFESLLAKLAQEEDFSYIAASHEVARELGFLARGETTVADAYLTPLLRRHVARLAGALPGSQLRFMQSSGGLTDGARFRGPTALLSGPAGGVVAAARVAARAGFPRAIGFDMGGTSTDVSLIRDGEVERSFETIVGGVRVKAPMLRIHTVAAGGGSLCRFDGFRLEVGPESAGADPGPLCYARDEASVIDADAPGLALTDVNFALGRVQPDRFPFPLALAPVDAALARVQRELRQAGFSRTRDEIAAGFVEVANANMAQAIAQVSVARGADPRECALVGFGGAAGQHVCAIARSLGIRQVLLHPLAGLLSAWGIGVAESSWDGQRDAGRVELSAGAGPLPEAVEDALRHLEDDGRRALEAEGVGSDALRLERWLDLRYAGTDAPLAIRQPGSGARPPDGPAALADRPAAFPDWSAAFADEHRRRFGYTREDSPIEIVTARVRAGGGAEPALAAHAPGDEPVELLPIRHAEVWFPEVGRTRAPIYARESLRPGVRFAGPALVLEDTGTVAVDTGFAAEVREEGLVVLTDTARAERSPDDDLADPDPVRLEVFGNRFMSIAEQMGAVLRNTAVSTNIKERLDYSCAVFDAEGGLVANAPHIPVHLGAMGETVRAVRGRFPDLESGDVVATNDPYEGGSHLPDVTVVTPVFADPGSPGAGPDFYVASRGHHADIGGRTPGSMPPDSRTLAEEGVLLEAFRVVHRGAFDERHVRELLSAGPWPARRPDDNVADLEAMVAANRMGERLLSALVGEQGSERVTVTMGQLQRAAAAKVAREIARLPDGVHAFADGLDDGTPVCVELRVRGERMDIDFAGTGPAVEGNLNAPRAVVHAAVIYVLRALVAERIPLNGGCMQPVTIRLPAGSLLDPPRGRAVVGGNVETSQRIVDVLLGALGLVAASQGTMNNVTFGDERFGYYETIGGGAGAGPDFDGASGVHTHMTNTRITDPEVLEGRYPVQLVEFSLRAGSGGAGRQRGGDGLVRSYRFTAPVTAALLSERRATRPYGLAGGGPGRAGVNRVERADGTSEELPGHCSVALAPGDRLRVETPGGGGYGAPGSLAAERRPG